MAMTKSIGLMYHTPFNRSSVVILKIFCVYIIPAFALFNPRILPGVSEIIGSKGINIFIALETVRQTYSYV